MLCCVAFVVFISDEIMQPYCLSPSHPEDVVEPQDNPANNAQRRNAQRRNNTMRWN